MTPGNDLLARVQTAQAELGTGDAADALELVEPLLDETAEALRAFDFLSRPPPDRRAVVEAFCYARVTAILALESVGAAAAVGRIRALAAEALNVAAEGNDAWKVLCAAAEMLSRAGDAEGAASAVTAAVRLAPEDEEYVRQLRGSIRSMFPAAFPKR
ncbi:MAG TPA: hypothetical protein VM287_06625 [Egibacteraceae bacterium]|nr:hypothetical protein [Egibacteraceae bacterium]